MRIFLLIIFLVLANLKDIHAQFIYPNDICSGARPLLVSNTGELTDTVYQRNTYADVALSPVPNCTGTGTVHHDLWYSFTAPTASVAVVPEYYTGFYQLFSGSCGSLTSNACNSSSTTFEPFTGLTPGQQYYLRTYSAGPVPVSASNFRLSLVSTPANDICTNAMLLPTNPLHAEALPLKRFTNELATETTDNSCGTIAGSWPGYEDLWFKFIATNATHSVYIQAPSTGTRVALYTGALGNLTQTGSTFNSSASVTAGFISLSNLTPGQTYYIRAGGSSVVKFSFSIVTGAPENDECLNADTVKVSSSFACENTYKFKRIGATTSSTPCAASSPNDVWFIFQATVPDITVIGLGDYESGMKLGLLSGSCGALTCLVNSNTSTLKYSGLTVGNYYYLKFGGVSF
jgi:trimeric autotransporter adhesin